MRPVFPPFSVARPSTGADACHVHKPEHNHDLKGLGLRPACAQQQRAEYSQGCPSLDREHWLLHPVTPARSQSLYLSPLSNSLSYPGQLPPSSDISALTDQGTSNETRDETYPTHTHTAICNSLRDTTGYLAVIISFVSGRPAHNSHAKHCTWAIIRALLRFLLLANFRLEL